MNAINNERLQQQQQQQQQGRLFTKRAFIESNPGFLKYGALNWLMFKHMSELRARGAVLKLGPKQLFIDETVFKAWVRDKALQNATNDGVYDNDI
jgi:hypothetical protein